MLRKSLSLSSGHLMLSFFTFILTLFELTLLGCYSFMSNFIACFNTVEINNVRGNLLLSDILLINNYLQVISGLWIRHV